MNIPTVVYSVIGGYYTTPELFTDASEAYSRFLERGMDEWQHVYLRVELVTASPFITKQPCVYCRGITEWSIPKVKPVIYNGKLMDAHLWFCKSCNRHVYECPVKEGD